MSRVFRSDPVAIGDRVVVRRRRGELASDVVGIVESVDPLVIRRGEELVEVGDFHIMKKLSPRTVRNSDIRAIETATARAFPGQEHILIDGWLTRAGAEIAERSNSATPIGHAAGFNPVPIDAIAEFYRSRGMPVQLLVPERIGKPALRMIDAWPTTGAGAASAGTAAERWTLGEEIIVMTRDLADLDPAAGDRHGAGDPRVRIDPLPDAEWLAMYHYRGQALPEGAVLDLAQRIDGQIGFARYLDAASTVAVTRATITSSDDGRKWLGYSAVEVVASKRRQGIGSQLGEAVLEWGAAEGADAAYLHVRASNAAGIALYEKLGFVEHHRHRYARLG